MRTLVFFTALLLGTNEKRIWELQSIIQSKAVFIWIIYWLKPGLKKIDSILAPEILECVICSQNETVLQQERCLKPHTIKNCLLCLLSPLFLAPEALFMVFCFVLFSSRLQPMRAETVLCNKVFNILLRIVCQPCCLPRQSIFQPGLHLGGAHQLPNNQISSGRPKDKVLSCWGQIGPGVVL